MLPWEISMFRCHELRLATSNKKEILSLTTRKSVCSSCYVIRVKWPHNRNSNRLEFHVGITRRVNTFYRIRSQWHLLLCLKTSLTQFSRARGFEQIQMGNWRHCHSINLIKVLGVDIAEVESIYVYRINCYNRTTVASVQNYKARYLKWING